MGWDSIQQMVRIVLYTLGGYLLGSEVAQGDLFQGAVSGLLSVGAFFWWWFWQHGRTEVANTPKPPSGPTPVA